MKTLTKTKKEAIKSQTGMNSSKEPRCSEEEIANTIIDTFNDHVYLSTQFKQKISSMIDSVEYEFPNDGIKLQKIIDLFLGASHKLMGDYMKTLLDSYLVRKPQTAQLTNEPSYIKPNKYWIEDWMEQSHYLNGKPEGLLLEEANMDDHFYYNDIRN